MNQYYKCTVKVEWENDKGQVKYRREEYIVDAITPSDAEKKLIEHMGTTDCEVINISATRIVDIVK